MSRQVTTKAVAGLLLLAGVSACATDALRVDYARTVAAEGKAAAEASKEFLHRVDIGRREANIELVAADPACGAESKAKVRKTPRIEAREGRGWLCVPPRWNPDEHHEFSLRPITPELAPTLDLISALTSYTEALGAIADEKADDPLKPLLDALETARAAEGAIQALRNRTDLLVPAADDKRIEAVRGFVALLVELAHERDQVKRLRAVVAKHPEGAAPVIASLRSHLRLWETRRGADAAVREFIVASIVKRSVDSRPPTSISARREALTSYYALSDANDASAKIHPALDDVLRELDKADRGFRRVLAPNPDLNDKERARIAELNRQRIVRALQSLTALITSFRGA